MRIPKFVPEVSRPDRLRVGLSDAIHAEECREQRQVTGDRIVEPGQESVGRMDAPIGIHADSRARTTVVPTAMTRPPFACVRFTVFAVSGDTANGSGYRACPSTVSLSISRLETPVWSRIGATRMPAFSSASRIRGVIGRAAEGISALPGTREKRVW